MARQIEAWAIFGRRLQKPHLDKIMRSPAEAWGLLYDELHPQHAKDMPLTTAAMRRMGYSCRKVKICWRDCAVNASPKRRTHMHDVDAMKRRALEQIKAAGRKGLQVERGWESRTQMLLVEEGLIWQEHGERGHWKFTLSPSGERALNQ